MDMSKMGNRSWSEPGLQPLSSSAVANFESDIVDGKVTNSVGDLLQLTRERTSRQFVGKANSKSTLKKNKKEKPIETSSELKGMKSSQYQNVHERPPRRVEVSYLENELKQMVNTVMNPTDDGNDDAVYHPHREKVMLIRNRIFLELGIEKGKSDQEPWLESIVKSECLKDLCDDVSAKLTDMLSVSSAELGNVLRKLRYTYDQSFLQAVSSWKELQGKYFDMEDGLRRADAQVRELNARNQENDIDIRDQITAEVEVMKQEYDKVQRTDKEKILQLEQQVDQMSGTLKNLNAIFKTMQSDVDAARSADTFARCSRLEREVADLEAQVSAAARVKNELDGEVVKSNNMSSHIEKQDREIENLKAELSRRDVTVAELMERETLRNAEIEKLTRMAAQRQENDEDLDLDPVASSVLCIKCKKSLDDISSIRDAILGKSSLQKLACQAYRILLPNNKGRKPHRSTSWLKACMRSVLTSKMVETAAVMPIGESVTAFPSFVYAWFEPSVNHGTLDSHSIQALYQRADEDRWGLYYGAKMLAKEDAEAKLFWGLLDEVQGEDGLVFVCHCMSVVLSIGGQRLWKQFGPTMNHASSSAMENVLNEANADNTPANIWLDLDTAFAAVKLILVRALESQVVETLDAIESLKVAPTIPGAGDCIDSVDSANDKDSNGVGYDNEKVPESGGEENIDIFDNQIPTHIDLFVWLRVMMQRFQDEQCHRHAAVRLMFDTASLGALAGPTGSVSSSSHNNSENPHVLFPQFIAVVRTLYPAMSVEEIAELYATSYKEGDGKVTAAIFAEVAEKKRLFSKSLKLSPLPLFVFDEFQSDGSNFTQSFDSNQNFRIRGEIGALVHAHYTIVSKEVENVVRILPQRWKALLTDASESVQHALRDHFVKLKSRKRNFNGTSSAVGGESVTSKSLDRQTTSPDGGKYESYIDGIQPFIQYHRLLTTLLLVKSFSENTILPLGFISTDSCANSKLNAESEGVVAGSKVSFKKVEQVLFSLENAVLAHSSNEVKARYTNIEHSRKNIILRRIQEVYRSHLSHDTAIPRPLRLVMRPGYLRGLVVDGLPPLKSRRVYIEPWALQTLVSSIFSFKLNYDLKATRVGFSLIDLPLATISVLLKLFNVPDVSERVLQDLCLGMQTYMHGLPRVRMFACFLGCGEVEEPFASQLRSSLAVATYLELLVTIHHVLMPSEKRSDSTKISINELFPCTMDPSSRLDKRDLWELPISTLTSATEEWSRGFKGFKEGTWITALSRVRRSPEGMAEVDDFLWVIMQVWAKAVVNRTHKCEQKAKAYCVKEGVVPRKNSPVNNRTTARGKQNVELVDEKALLNELSFPHPESMTTVSNMLNSIHASSSTTGSNGGVTTTTDMIQCSTMYGCTISATRNCNYVIFESMLRSCILWDTTTSPKELSPHVVETSQEGGEALSVHTSFVSLRLFSEVSEAVPSTLSLRFAQSWWMANKEGVLSEMNIVKSICDGSVEKQSSQDDVEVFSPVKITEMTKQIEVAKKIVFQLEKILLEANSGSASCFGNAVYDAEKGARSGEVWHLISYLNGIIGDCLKSIGHKFPRDLWKSGRKLHLDRASAYLMQVQPNLSS